MKKKKIRKFMEELEELKKKAEYRSRLIIDNGQEVPEAHKSKAEGAANAYDYCILRLGQLCNET